MLSFPSHRWNSIEWNPTLCNVTLSKLDWGPNWPHQSKYCQWFGLSPWWQWLGIDLGKNFDMGINLYLYKCKARKEWQLKDFQQNKIDTKKISSIALLLLPRDMKRRNTYHHSTYIFSKRDSDSITKTNQGHKSKSTSTTTKGIDQSQRHKSWIIHQIIENRSQNATYVLYLIWANGFGLRLESRV